MERTTIRKGVLVIHFAYTWNKHKVVNQLYSNTKFLKKLKVIIELSSINIHYNSKMELNLLVPAEKENTLTKQKAVMSN